MGNNGMGKVCVVNAVEVEGEQSRCLLTLKYGGGYFFIKCIFMEGEIFFWPNFWEGCCTLGGLLIGSRQRRG